MFEFLDEHAEIDSVDGQTVYLVRTAASSRSLEELAASLTYEGLVKSEIRGDRIAVDLDSPGRAQMFAESQDVGFALGPYVIRSVRRGESGAVVRLRSRGRSAISAIDLIEVSSTEEGWRRLLGRDVDVVPALSERFRYQFEDVESVRVVEIQSTSVLALVFNHRSDFRDLLGRRTVVESVDRTAIADIACRSEACRVPELVHHEPKTNASKPLLTFRLSFLTNDEVARVVATVARHQLELVGHRVILDPIPLESIARIYTDDWDAAIFPVPIADQHRWPTFASSSPRAFTGWSSAEYDAAVERRDWARAREIAAEQILFKPLVQMRSYAAIDAAWCGGKPTTLSNWIWLADLRPCSDGEQATSEILVTEAAE